MHGLKQIRVFLRTRMGRWTDLNATLARLKPELPEEAKAGTAGQLVAILLTFQRLTIWWPFIPSTVESHLNLSRDATDRNRPELLVPAESESSLINKDPEAITLPDSL
jgi:hypothetical protein